MATRRWTRPVFIVRGPIHLALAACDTGFKIAISIEGVLAGVGHVL